MMGRQETPPAPKQPAKFLLDVSVLLAVIWSDHPKHSIAFRWVADKRVLLCPLSELGFLRISTNKKVIGAPMEKARRLLQQFASDRAAGRISDDLAALDSHPKKSEEVTDVYLAELAARHGAQLATFDQAISHSAVEVIS